MKKWKSALCFLLSASCLTPAVSVATFAQEFETNELSDSTAKSENEKDDSQASSETTDQDSSDKDSSTDSSEDSTDEKNPDEFDWYKDPATVYEAKVYQGELNELKTEDPAEEKAIEKEQTRMEEFLNNYEGQEMYRLYNPNSGEHFYTANPAERDYLIKAGWQDEGIGWMAPKSAGDDVYRLYNANAGDHHYTLDANERDYLVKAGWTDEGIGWKSAGKDDEGNTLPVWREYNPNQEANNHNYTINHKEHRILTQMGWNNENIGWYALSPYSRIEGKTGTIQFYDNDSLKRLEGEQVIGGDIYYLDPANDGKAYTGLLHLDGKIYIHGEDGKRLYGMTDFEGSTYLLDDQDGEAKIGTTLVDETTDNPRFVTFDDQGRMIKNRTVNGVRYGEDGTKQDLTTDEQLEIDCNKVYNEVGRDLHAVYNWTWSTLTYARFDPEWQTPPNGMSHEQNFARIGFDDHRGNGYTYAATFTYLAKNLGYDASFIKGEILLTTGWTEHGWVKITIDGKDYFFDPTFERSLNGGGERCWMQDAKSPKFQYRYDTPVAN